ncbi:MAG: nucleotidyl transferase AbiEii/AbiGii toxin family protein [Patescibacteria group bacterium]
MVTARKDKIAWHYESLPVATTKALEYFSVQQWIKSSTWYLAGGTALALQAGHRMSVDLDFFTPLASFHESALIARLGRNKAWRTTLREQGTVYGEFHRAKISFLAYPLFIRAQRPKWHGMVRVLDARDIAVMKIIAITQRGSKRDFFDLFWCAQHIEPLEDIIRRLKKQYPSVAHDYHHILKSLVYFDDAEHDPDLQIHFRASWKMVKEFFTHEVPATTLRLMK